MNTRILLAAKHLKSIVNYTPLMTSRSLNERVGNAVWCKCENFQRSGSFKIRGAYNAISQLSPDQWHRGVITHSSGNHGQAVALAAHLCGIRATVVVPEYAPKVKVAAMKSYGAEIVTCKNSQKDRELQTAVLMEQQGFTLVHSFDNDDVIAGQGTVALELLQEILDLDYLFVPVGGGGLLSGTSIAAKHLRPQITVIGVEPCDVDDAFQSFRQGHLVHTVKHQTIADGLRMNLSERTFGYIQQYVDDILTVTEQEIIEAMRFLWERMKLIIEPSGAVAFSAVYMHKLPRMGKKIGVILSGGNVELGPFFHMLNESMQKTSS